MLIGASHMFIHSGSAVAGNAAESSAKGPVQTGAEKPVEQSVRTEPGQDTTKPNGQPKDSVELSREAEEIRQLQTRDREVRAHEAAHAAAGGAYAGAPTYTMKRGPDGKSYATGGEVSIDISPVSGDPKATLEKAEQVRSAALAPVQPSSQDMRVAQKAQAMAAEARAEIAAETSETIQSANGQSAEADASSESSVSSNSSEQSEPSFSGSQMSGVARLSVYS